VRDEWLSEKLNLAARALRAEIAQRDKAQEERRHDDRGRHYSYPKTARRAKSRAAPDAPDDLALRHA